MMIYLSLVPNPPKICLLTGGIAPMLTNVDDAYCASRERVKKRSFEYYERYPGDIYLVKKIVKKLMNDPAPLPSGGTLTARRFLQLGISLGGSPSSFASLHSLFSSACLSEDDDDFACSFLKTIDYAELSGLSMRAIAYSLSRKDDWDKLYDSEQMRGALATNGTGVSKAAAAVYYDDMYVDFDVSMKVTQRGNPLENGAVWINNDYQHSGLRGN